MPLKIQIYTLTQLKRKVINLIRISHYSDLMEVQDTIMKMKMSEILLKLLHVY